MISSPLPIHMCPFHTLLKIVMEEILGIAQHFFSTTIQIIDKNHRYIIYKISLLWFLEGTSGKSVLRRGGVFRGGGVMALGIGVYSGEVRRRITALRGSVVSFAGKWVHFWGMYSSFREEWRYSGDGLSYYGGV